jgi:hypothetical protein
LTTSTFSTCTATASAKERAPGGGKDENVFDIQQGVAIGISSSGRNRLPACRVRYADLWGDRQNQVRRVDRKRHHHNSMEKGR